MNPTLESLKKPADVSHLAASLPPTITTCRLRDHKKRPHIGIRGHTCARVLGPAPLVLPHSLQVPHIRATMPSHRAAQPPAAPPSTSKGLVSVMLTPFMALAFVLLHAIYQLAILAHSVASAVSRATRRRSHRPASSFASLSELLAEHECAPELVRVPDHLAVVLADAAPSSLRLYLSTQWMRLHSSNTKQGDFHATYQAAVEAKHVEDAATLIHLAAISGVRRLSIYTCEPLGAQALQHLTRHLHLAYKIRGVIHPTSSQQSEPSEPSPWKYTELRRRTRLRRADGSDASTSSAPGSPASSDSEAAPSSLDETLASSYTAETEPFSYDVCSATVDIRLGLSSPALPSEPSLQVVLLSHCDGQDHFAHLVSTHVHERARSYLSTVVLSDIASSSRFSASRLRKAWVSRRERFVGDLDVARLDAHLRGGGYLDEPELLVVRGSRPSLRRLYGFPAWPLRITDLFYDETLQPHARYATHDFVAALRKLARAEQRHGK